MLRLTHIEGSDALSGRSRENAVLVKAVDKRERRPVVSRGEIVLALRRRIASGEWASGSRLPTQLELRSEMKANIVTLGRAIDQLRLEGFLDTQGARGTFVSMHPPHLFRYALVFPSHPSQENWPRFWEALAKEAAAIGHEGELEIPVYYDVDKNLRGASRDYERLQEDVLAHRLAGVIFASHPYVVDKTPILDEPGMPRVALMAPQPADYPQLATVITSGDTLIERALDYLAAKGRKRLGVLSVPMVDGQYSDAIRRQAAARGLETRPYWMQSAGRDMPISAQTCIHLMMRDGQADRPDALLVTDDNLVEYATAGLVCAGVRVPAEVDVVVHCNFPWPTPSVVPVRRIGFDSGQLLEACIGSINAQRQGGPLPSPVTVPAIFEDELNRTLSRSISQFRSDSADSSVSLRRSQANT